VARAFSEIPEALIEGEVDEEARTNAIDCLIAALEGYMKAGRPIPRPSVPGPDPDRAMLPSLVTAKLAVYETMRKRGWSKTKLAKELGVPEIRCAGCWTYTIARKWGSLTRRSRK
jgi:antitoxin HicB